MSGLQFTLIGQGSGPHNYGLAWDSTTVPNGLQTLFCFVRFFGGPGRGVGRVVDVRN